MLAVSFKYEQMMLKNCSVQFLNRPLAKSYPARPSSHGSSKSSKRECSAVVLRPQAFKSSAGFITLPQHSGDFVSSAATSTVFPQLAHSYTCISAISDPPCIYELFLDVFHFYYR
jgi:hypothetical protein